MPRFRPGVIAGLVALALQTFRGYYGTQWLLMMSVALLLFVPIPGIFLPGRRFFISRLTVGVVTG